MEIDRKKGKVLVAMSGGVDSTLAAVLLNEAGYKVYGATMKLFTCKTVNLKGHSDLTVNEKNIETAQKVAQKLKIPWSLWDFSIEFKEEVIKYFSDEYLSGRTPNPCVKCNHEIKFKLFLRKALSCGMDYIATGHYAINEFDEHSKQYILKKAKDQKKDQSYFLYTLGQSVLPHVLFPLGGLKKERVRELADQYGLENYDKPESQEICFIPDNDYRRFLESNFSQNISPGHFRDKNGNIFDKHKGVAYFTIGQRRKLGISLNKRQYVVKIDALKNDVILGDDCDLYQDKFVLNDLHIVSDENFSLPTTANIKIRYNCKETRATLYKCEKGKISVKLDNPLRAVTPGQSAVFYRDDYLLGGGIIE